MATVKSSSGDGALSDSSVQTANLGAPADPLAGPLPLRDGRIRIGDLIDLYMAHYSGRDSTRVQRLSWWRARIADVALQDLADDDVYAAIEELSSQPSRFFAGKDASGVAIYRRRRSQLSPATLNRYLASLAAVITWAIKRRIAPKGYVHPCRTVERRRENNEKTRFLSDEERGRLLAAVKACSWPRMHALVVLALTTGARKGELLALRWRDVDLDRGLAYCSRTKNGDARALPLTPSAVELLTAYRASPGALVFPSGRHPDRPFSIETVWRRALKDAKIRNFRFHDLRHTCASMLAQNGATLLEIADVLGHRQLQVTKRYSHLTTAHKTALVNKVLSQVT